MEQATHKERVVLPTTVKPSKYNITLQPDLKNFTFSGEEEVTIEVLKETTEIVLNSIELKISSVEFKAGDKALTATKIDYDEKRETATFTFDQTLPVGAATLKVAFTGVLNDKLKGFYRSKYTNAQKEEVYMGVTQFEPTDARRALPCWDEPAIKATFVVTLVVPKALTALSNMPVVSETNKDADLKTVTFDETPIMSTYLLAFVVGEFDYVEDKTSNGVVVRVYTPLGKSEQGLFALQVAVKTLPFYDDYFGIPYPLPKSDLIAIPDFAAGAMENWGLVTYRETAVLVDPVNSSAASKQWVALVVGHELAHQWFGNLVTMEWWTHLWLNEGFASWIEYLAVDHCFPEWDIWTQFVFSDLGRAFGLDCLKSTHPVEVEVADAAEIDEIFDIISYSKGCSIVRMLASFLGNDVFKKGLNIYLNRHKYANALTEDLWAALSETSGKPVKELMDHWTKQDGYPVLFVSEKESKDAETTLEVTQSRFLSTGEDSSITTIWWVPIGVATPHGTVQQIIKDKTSTVTVKADKNEWIKFNPGVTGFYRVRYTDELLNRLRAPIESLELPPADRLGIQGDAFALARAGMLPTTHVLSLLSAFKNEENYTVYSDLSANIGDLATVVSATDYYPSFTRYAASLYENIVNKVGWDAKEGEGHLISLLRTLVLGAAGKYGHAATIAEAQKRFAKFLDDRSSLHADMRGAVYRICLANAPEGDDSVYESVLRIFRETDLHEEKERCMRALGASSDPKLLQKTLEFAMGSEVRSQDTVFVIAGVAANPKGRELAWKFVQEKWTELFTRYDGGFLLSRLVQTTSADFTTEEKAKEVEAFFAVNKAPAAERAVKQSVEKIRSNARWLANDGEAMGKWFAEWAAGH